MGIGSGVMRKRTVLTLLLAAVVRAAPLPLMPVPLEVTPAQGELRIDSSFGVVTNGYSDFRLEAAVKRFVKRVERQTGQLAVEPHRQTLVIDCRERGSDYPALGDDESYELEVSSSVARL